MRHLPYLLNTLWMWRCRREWRAYQRAVRDPRAAQDRVLMRTIRTNADTDFGRRHGFASITSPADFRRRVPLSRYESYTEAIERIGRGEPRVLTSEPVRLLEPTSGSTSGRKLIPYTDSLRREFQRMLAVWIYDLFRNRPAVRRGRAYWSISPATGERERTSGGIPIGFDDDTAYLGGLERLLMRRLLAVPSEVARIGDVNQFRYETLFALLNAGDLSLISVWSPTFLTTLLERLQQWTGRLCDDFAIRPGVRTARSQEVRRILESSASPGEKHRQLWPNLALVSCWADAAAANFLPELQRMLPWVEIQPKGLLSTEGCVSLPLVGRNGAALALRSHFFEFVELHDAAESDNTRLADKLQAGGEYALAITTGGGLYRYQTGDIVKVVGFENRCPLLKFLGRTESTGDLVGEKLAEPFVRNALDAVIDEFGIAPRFAIVVPIESGQPRYRLYVQPGRVAGIESKFCEELATRVQQRLEENPHYRYAVRCGQLGPIDARILRSDGESGWTMFERRNLAEGRKAGDIKPVALDTRSGWDTVFDPQVAIGDGERVT